MHNLKKVNHPKAEQHHGNDYNSSQHSKCCSVPTHGYNYAGYPTGHSIYVNVIFLHNQQEYISLTYLF